MSVSKRIIRGVLSMFGSQVATMAIKLASLPIIIRILGASNYGDYAVIGSSLALISIFTRVGISTGIRKYIGENRESDQWEDNVYAFYLRIGLVIAIIGAIVIFFANWMGVVGDILGSQYTTYFYLLSIILVIQQFQYIARYTLIGLHQEHYSELLQVIDKLVFVFVGVSLAYIGFGVIGLLTGMAVAAAISAALAFYTLREHVNIYQALIPTPDEFPRSTLLTFNITNTIFIFLTMSLYHTDVLLLQHFTTSRITGIYKSALVIAEFLWFVPIAIQTVFIHSSSELWSNEKINQLQTLSSRTTRYNILLLVLLVLGIVALARPFVRIYFGREFLELITPLLFLLPGAMGFAIARPIYAINQGIGRMKLLILATGCSAIINLVLNVLLIPRLGMTGAAISTSIGYGSMMIFHTGISLRVGVNPVSDIRLGRVIFTATLSAPVIFGTSRLINNDLLSLIIVPPLGFICYLIASIWTGALNQEEISDVLNELPDRIKEKLEYVLEIINIRIA